MSARMSLVLLTMAGLFGVSRSDARSFRFNSTCHSYSAPVTYRPYNYYTPPAQTYTAPTYTPSYQQEYPVQKVVAQEVTVAPIYVTVPVVPAAVSAEAYGTPYYWSATQTYQAKSALRDVIREELRNFVPAADTAKAPATKTPEPKTPEPKTPEPKTPEPKKAAESKTAVADDTTPADLQKEVLAALTSRVNCVSCHGGSTKDQGDFKLVLRDAAGAYKLVKLSSDKRWKAYAMASVGAMPPSAADDAAKAMETKYLNSMLKWAAIKD